MDTIRLTQFSHGAGCGCKISPKVLDQILSKVSAAPDNKQLLVGNHSRDDAAVYDLGNGTALISTTDFFMPIVDDPFDFGRIAAANAISDVYAMGGTPLLAIAILGWPVDKISPDIAGQVVQGGRQMCTQAGIPLAGGHSIDSPEPIFGLAVSGIVDIRQLRQNDTARAGDLLYLTKPLGIGAITTAEKKGIVLPGSKERAVELMTRLNSIGAEFSRYPWVHAMTDVTGFGLLGHLVEMSRGANLSATVWFEATPIIEHALEYIAQGAVPGGTHRNWASYGSAIDDLDEARRLILSDPQTSGGLLIAIDAAHQPDMESLMHENGLGEFARPIGQFTVSATEPRIRVI